MSDGQAAEVRWRKCIHEAGHALVALLEGIPIDHVKAPKNQAWNALADRETSMRDQPGAMFRFGHAGARAEADHFKERPGEPSPEDRDIIEDAKRRIGVEDPRVGQRRLASVEETIRDHRPELEALARFICAHGRGEKIPWSKILEKWQEIQKEKQADADDAPET